MSKRLFDTLAAWVTMEPSKLAAALQTLTGEAATALTMSRARTLFTSAIETPGGLKVQTIHAFCERLLQRFPLEAGVPPSFTILEDDTTQKLMREAIDSVLSEGATHPESDIGRALKTAVAHITDTRFDEVLKDALAYRNWIEHAGKPPSMASQISGFDAVEAAFLKAFGIRDGSTAAATAAAIRSILTQGQLARLHQVLQQGTANDQGLAKHVAAASKAVADDKFVGALSRVFQTKKGEPRSRLLTKILG